MPRQLRLEYPGAIYHVMSRGDQREDIFLEDVDRHDFIKTLAEACQKTDWQIHAFCLMRNHYHLVLETPNANLVCGMAWLQNTYTSRALAPWQSQGGQDESSQVHEPPPIRPPPNSIGPAMTPCGTFARNALPPVL